ncbi:MAG TPA: VWA domain-containing protein [Planctomycetes bacterium]|nr:VWA domain-containing protein [Planctomycetota bacterium]
MHCRIDFMELAEDSAALDRLAAALNQLYDEGVIAEMAQQHDDYFYDGIHWSPQFLPWHRHFLLRLEKKLQAIDARIVLPYWDWTRADSRDLDAEPWKSFFGGRNNTGGRFDHWSYTRASSGGGNTLPSLDDVADDLRDKANFTEFRAIECGDHFPGHTWTGGTMASRSSPLDPLFYLHHGNLDRIWAIWQLNNPTKEQYSTAGISCGASFGVDSVAEDEPMVGGATPGAMLVHTALGYSYPRDLNLEAHVAGDPDFPAFVSGDQAQITLETPQIVFNDVPSGDTTMRAALFRIEGCGPISFEVEAGPSGSFSLFTPGPYAFPAGPFPTDELRIWVLYTGGTPDTTDPGGTMTVVAKDDEGVEIGRWDDIPILANTVARPTVAVALVLDESGSMLSDAGNNRTRIAVLRDAATTFVDQLYDDNAVTLISFANASDKLTDLAVAGGMTSMVRNDARDAISLHGPASGAPLTSIGAGLQRAADEFTTSPIAGDFDVQATVVFTDGYQTQAPYIADVAGLINDRVYAVGIADAAHVDNASLVALADSSGGYMLVTGALEQDDEFLLEKFFIQILAGVTNRDIVTDPGGWLSLGEVARIPFSIANSDVAFDAIGLTRAPQYTVMALEAPDGTIIDASRVPPGAHRIGQGSSAFRVTLPLVVDGKEHWEGKWHLLMALRWKGGDERRQRIQRTSTHALSSQAALRYEAVVHARSNLHLSASLTHDGSAPGSTLFLRAVLTEYGQPLQGDARVHVTMTRPDGTTEAADMLRVGPGQYEFDVITSLSGAHRFRLRAEGLSARGHTFTREHLLSGLVGPPAADGGVRAGTGSGDDLSMTLCRLWKCLAGGGAFHGRFSEKLAEWGIDAEAAARCLHELCAGPRAPGGGGGRSNPRSKDCR